jgi:hypothetical protein
MKNTFTLLLLFLSLTIVRAQDPLPSKQDTSVATIASLESYSGGMKFMFVRDRYRGGDFYYTTTSLIPDSGKIFPATGKGSGFWVRQTPNKDISPDWYNETGDDYKTIQSAILHADAGATLRFKRNLYTIGHSLEIYKPLSFDFNFATLKAADTAGRTFGGSGITMYVIQVRSDNVNIANAVINGNMHVRTPVLIDSLATTAIILDKVSNCTIKNVICNNIGGTDIIDPASRASVLNGAGVYILGDSLVTHNVGNNIVENLTINDTSGRVSWGVRIVTNTQQKEGNIQHWLQNNKITNLLAYGIGKSIVEMSGPNTRNNMVENAVCYNFMGEVGYDWDFGASYNNYKNCRITGLSAANLNSVYAFSASVTQRAGIPPQHSSYNVCENCSFTDATSTASRTIIALFSEIHGRNNTFNGTINNVYAPSGTVVGAYIHEINSWISGRDTSYGVTFKDCNFLGVTDAFRFENAGITENATVDGGTFNASNYVINAVDTVNGLTVRNIKSAKSANSFFSSTSGRGIQLLNNHIYVTSNVVAIKLPHADSAGYNKTAIISGNYIENLADSSSAITRGDTTGSLPYVSILNNVFNGGFLGNLPLASINYAPTTIIGNLNLNPIYISRTVYAPSIMYSTAIPSAGTWKKGDIIINSIPVAGGIDYWKCVIAGTPGTWTAIYTAPQNTGIQKITTAGGPLTVAVAGADYALTVSSTASIPTNGTTKNFTITYTSVGYTPSNVVWTPTNTLSALPFYITGISGTGFTVNYVTAPATGIATARYTLIK